MDTLVLQTKNKRQTKELLSFAKAQEIKAFTPEEVKDQAIASMIMNGLKSRRLTQEESDAFFNSLGK